MKRMLLTLLVLATLIVGVGCRSQAATPTPAAEGLPPAAASIIAERGLTPADVTAAPQT